MKNKNFLLLFIAFLVIGAIFTILKVPTKLGLDLKGGSKLILQAQKPANVQQITPEMMDSLRFAIERRVNALGVAETVVQKIGTDRLLVEIPGISDSAKARQYIGETAALDFREQKPGFNNQPTWENTGVSGKDLSSATLAPSPGGGNSWVIEFKLNSTGSKKFGDLTTRLQGKPLGIFFNGKLQSAPVVQTPITDGSGQITGSFSYDDAKKMVDLLNAGALPLPAKIIEENSVGPTLGAESIHKSLIAGLVGIGLVMLFMVAYYRVPGLIADAALIIYALLVFAIFKIIPVTLTLAGIAGFILSIGMAVDANILIFERTKEELRAGRTLFTAINAGFDRAFTSIFDSNMTTIITCTILYLLGTSIVRGFALTLAIGVIVSMFTAITVTRTFMHVMFGAGQLKHPGWFGLKQSDISKTSSQDTSPRRAKLGVLE